MKDKMATKKQIEFIKKNNNGKCPVNITRQEAIQVIKEMKKR